MPILSTYHLSQTEKNNIETLINLSQIFDKQPFSLPLEEDGLYFLLYEENKLLSLLFALPLDSHTLECMALTRPDRRKEGLFVRLLAALADCEPEKDILFPNNPGNRLAVAVMEAIEAEEIEREHMMNLELAGRPSFASSFHDSWHLKADQKKGSSVLSYTLTNIQGQTAGQCFVDLQKTRGYFYGLEIQPKLRGQGLGTLFLSLVLSHLSSLPVPQRPTSLSLQVSGQNLPALALYKKAGFQITESLAYYLY